MYTKTRSEPFKAVETATYNHPVGPVISYTEAARDIVNMQLYLMIWIEAILKSIIIIIIIINVLFVSQILRD